MYDWPGCATRSSWEAVTSSRAGAEADVDQRRGQQQGGGQGDGEANGALAARVHPRRFSHKQRARPPAIAVLPAGRSPPIGALPISVTLTARKRRPASRNKSEPEPLLKGENMNVRSKPTTSIIRRRRLAAAARDVIRRSVGPISESPSGQARSQPPAGRASRRTERCTRAAAATCSTRSSRPRWAARTAAHSSLVGATSARFRAALVHRRVTSRMNLA